VDRRYLPDLLYGLHVDLLVAPWVTAVFGFISLLWLIDHVLALPRRRTQTRPVAGGVLGQRPAG